MRHDDHRHSSLGKVAHDVQDLADDLGVESRGRLVEEHKVRLHAEGARNCDTLLLAAGKRHHRSLREVGKTDSLEVLHGLLLGICLRGLLERHRRERAVVEHIEVREQVEALEHHADLLAQAVHVHMLCRQVLAAEPHMALIRRLEQVDAAQERRLAGARSADDRDDLAGHDIEVDALEHLMLAEALAEPLDAHDRLRLLFAHFSSPPWALATGTSDVPSTTRSPLASKCSPNLFRSFVAIIVRIR